MEGMANHSRIYVIPSHTKKVFGNMRMVGKEFSGKVTPLFPTMMVQAQEEMGEGSANPTDPHHTPTIIQPSTSQPLRKEKPRKTKRKNTELPQTSVPTKHVVDEAVNEEMDDSLEMATTTATSLDVEQDRGNINKTQSKATPSEPVSQETSSGGGLRRQDTMRDIIAQTRVKRLEKKRRSRTHGLKRLYKVRLSVRIESSADEASLDEEDASKQGSIFDINDNQDICMVNVHRDEDVFCVNDQDDTTMFDADKDLQGEEVVVEKEAAAKDVNDVKEVNASSITTYVSASAATTTAVSIDELTLAQALVKIKTSKPKAKGILMQEPSEATTTTAIIPTSKVQDKGKGIMIKPEIPMKKKAQISLDEELAYKLQAEEEEEEKIAREKAQQKPSLKNESFAEIQELFDKIMKKINSFVDFRMTEECTKKDEAVITQEGSSKRAGDGLEQERSKKQKVQVNKETEELKQCLQIILDDGDDVTIDATPLSSKPSIIIDYKVYKEGNKHYFQIFRADGNSQMYLTFSKMLKNFDREDLVLWRIVKDRFEKIDPVDYMDSLLLHNLKTMFEHHVEDNV
uniref:Uncharacterized protein n=1 Tax=Tanacetum cinerariifolium TaxID=118510 RepID=A0A6L2LCB0_TANCI|nr:hypothetical protein [Tanacetum cinerariifolium]